MSTQEKPLVGDMELEKAIDEVGRFAVFGAATMMGWSAMDDVPKHVWWGIVNKLRQINAKPS